LSTSDISGEGDWLLWKPKFEHTVEGTILH